MQNVSAPRLGSLLEAVQDLSLARSLDDVISIVRTAARRLADADGATFVLREDDLCYYADEDAIGPLWKGKRFPMSACISGWVMIHRQATTVPDIYMDPRIPVDAYEPTFVRSLSMVPIREKDPVGAIGCYWAKKTEVSPETLWLIQALANSTSIAIENVRLRNDLERKVRERTAELEAFSYAISHDLRSPIRSMQGFSSILESEFGSQFTGEALNYLNRIKTAATRMGELVDALLRLAQMARTDAVKESVDLSRVAREILEELAFSDPDRTVDVIVQDGIMASGDSAMLRTVLENLLRNAWKFTRKTQRPRIEFTSGRNTAGKILYSIRDNGAGFNPAQADRLFIPFHRLHTQQEFEGTGIGLATVQKILSRHGGSVWARSEPGRGAEFYFDLPI